MADDAAAAAAAANDLAKTYDLTPKLIPNLDRHLIFPLIEFLDTHEFFSHQEMLQAKFDLLKSTNMTDFVGSLWKEIHNSDETPKEFAGKREEVLDTLKRLEEESRKVLDLFENEEVVSSLRSDKLQNMKYLEENHGVRLIPPDHEVAFEC